MMKVAYDFNPLMYKFIGKWGKYMVPIDLQVAIINIEINLFDTEHVTDWPNLVPHEENMLPNNNTPYKKNQQNHIEIGYNYKLKILLEYII
jgi:hypothetical protein